jgi:hypothetical protein
VQFVELPQRSWELGDADMQEVVELEVMAPVTLPICIRLIPVALADLPTEKIDGLVSCHLK